MSLYGDDDENIGTNPSTAPHLRDIVQARASRRGVLVGGMATVVGFMAPSLLAAPAHAGPKGKGPKGPKGPAGLLGFTAIPLSAARDISVAPGYTATPFLPWGTPILGSYPPFVPGPGGTAQEQEQQVGMHHDGMHFFPLDGSKRGLLVFNHEYTDEQLLHVGDRSAGRPAAKDITLEQVRKSQAAHGVSVVEVKDERGTWQVVKSKKNRRITANTPMSFGGAATGHPLLQTPLDPAGTTPVGTVNNCSHGYTPWGTYLACEENFNGYFTPVGPFDDAQTKSNKRYGVTSDRYYWGEKDKRFSLTTENANEANRFGWVVEIDPMDPTSTPVKRTALGRFKHEGAFVHITKGQRVVVYMGDDQADEFVYKFVSSANWKSLRARGIHPLDSGILYVGRFDDSGRGTWLPLVHGQNGLTAENGFADQATVLIRAREAATQLGATPLHRPEWTAVDPNTGAVYLTLTNHSSAKPPTSKVQPRKPDNWGQVLRWYEDNDDHRATSFTWDIFVLAGVGREDGNAPAETRGNVKVEDGFGSPDGLWVDRDSRVWIQTDGRQPGGSNDQMLAANPFVVDAYGAPEIKRFFNGVLGCEVTGVIDTPDQRTMFINIQHPGDDTGGKNDDGSAQPELVTWPYNDDFELPRSSVVVIRKDDGGVIGT